MNKIRLPYYSVSDTDADFLQIYFRETPENVHETSLKKILNDKTPYFIIQKQFEFPDGDVCSFETNDPGLRSESKVLKASLYNNVLYFKLQHGKCKEFEITFDQDKGPLKKLVKMLKIMIPHAEINNDKKC